MQGLFRYIITFLLLLPIAVQAQKPFVEGTILYSIKLQQADGSSDQTVHNGTYIITVKGKQLKKEFKLDNDFDNAILYNGDANTAYSLKVTQGKKYAIQLDAQELVNRTSSYRNFRLEDQGGNTTVAGLAAQKAKVTYRDGASVDILYTKEWKPADEYLFEHFPSINGLPLDFTYKVENGALIHFHAEKVESNVVESGVFRLSKDCKIISNAEYQQLSK